LIGLDIGTSSVKGVLMSVEGKVIRTARQEFVYSRTPDGKVEIWPEEYLRPCFTAIRTLAEGALDGEIKGICASSASGNLLLLDEKGEPMIPIIGWQDKRVNDEARECLPELDAVEYHRRIGWPISYQLFPLAQLCYIKKHNPELLAQCGKVCMSTEYLYYVLTEKWGISTSAGTDSRLMDQEQGTYITEFLEILGIPEEKLPPIYPCGHVVGTVTKKAAELCGLAAGTPVMLGSFDHPSAARGVGVLKEGQMLLSCGTSWVVFCPVNDREKGIRAGKLVDPFLGPQGCRGVMYSVPSLSERLKLYTNHYISDGKDAFLELSGLAAKSEPGAGGLTIRLLDEPDDAKILAYPKKHIARAIMENAVVLLKAGLDYLKEYDICANEAVMVGGPSEDPYWIQLIQDICGISVRVEHEAFAGAVGAAAIAGIGAGLYENEEDYYKKVKG